MSKDEKLAQIAAKIDEEYSIRKQALDNIVDKNIIWQLAEYAKDDWIRLEAAIIARNTEILRRLINHPNEQIRLESAIELNDQKVLTDMVLNSEENLYREMALRYITDRELLYTITEQSNREKEKVEAAIVLGDRLVLKDLFYTIHDEELQFKIARKINDPELLRKLSAGSTNSRVRDMAGDLADDFNPGSDID
ncbi:MAG: hypothetical protein JXB24_10665 [Bacteroidales bacterium]|nr:hypothetical protein [Bacteroidales bacterium]